jgi:DNA modification methylase
MMQVKLFCVGDAEPRGGGEKAGPLRSGTGGQARWEQPRNWLGVPMGRRVDEAPVSGGSGEDRGADGERNGSTNSGDDTERKNRQLVVDYRPLAALIPYARNARTHTDAQVAEIAGSIRAFGFTNPVLVDGDSGIIAGHGRVLAARQLGMGSVPVIELAGMSEAEKRAYIIADNKLALKAGWDDAMLAAEIGDLKDLGFDLALTGFAFAEIDALLAGNGPTFADEAPPLPEHPITRMGDVWTIGPHRLVCGDATDPAVVAMALAGGLADMVFTDPPYNVAYARGKVKKAIANDDLGSEFGAFLGKACLAMLPLTKGAVYICMSSSELGTLKAAFEAAGGHWSTFVIWSKNAFTLGRSDYQRQYEPILYGWAEGSDHYWCGARDQGDIWQIDKPRANDLHPTMKPVALVERAIRNSSKGRATILDPFGGSGTTLMAAEATGRQAALVELDPAYCDVIVRRWQEGTGGKATRQDGSGMESTGSIAPAHPALQEAEA